MTPRHQNIIKKWSHKSIITRKKQGVLGGVLGQCARTPIQPDPPNQTDPPNQPDQPDRPDLPNQPDLPNKPDPPNQPDPHYTKCRTPIFQSTIPGPAECAKRLNNIYVFIKHSNFT